MLAGSAPISRYVTSVESLRATPLTVADLAPLRRLLGSHSMVIRVNDDGTLSPFELMPELFLGRSIRQLLVEPIRDDFEALCRDSVANRVARTFSHRTLGNDEVIVNPVLNSAQTRCQFLVCWARQPGALDTATDADIGWHDLSLDDVQIRYRAIDPNMVEASPWWMIGRDGIDLWKHPHRIGSVGLASSAMGELVLESLAATTPFDDCGVRLLVPAADMLVGAVPLCHSALAATGKPAERVEIAVPVELAVDADLLPLIVHLRAMGLQIDIVGLNELTAKLQRVSHTAADPDAPTLPGLAPATDWHVDVADAVADARRLA